MIFLIRHKLPAMLKKRWKDTAGMIITAMLGITLLFAMTGIYHSMHASVDGFFADYENPQAVVSVYPADPELADSIKTIDGVRLVSSRAVYDAAVRREDGTLLTGRFFSSLHNGLPIYTLSGRNGKDGISLMPNGDFAVRNGFTSGDQLEVITATGDRRAEIGEIVSTPESMNVTRDVFTSFDYTDFGYFYLDSADMKALFGITDANQFIIQFAPDADKEAVLDRVISTLEKETTIIDHYIFEGSSYEEGIYSNFDGLRWSAFFVPPLFCSVTILCLFLSLTHMIKRDQKDIGILRALGFSANQCICLYCAYSLVITICAVIAGIAAGIVVMAKICQHYRSLFFFETMIYKADIPVAVLASVILITAGVFSVLINWRSFAGTALASSIKGTVPSTSCAPWLARKLPLSPVNKIVLTEGLRHKWRFLSGVLCICLAMSMMVIVMHFYQSKTFLPKHTFDERYAYDCEIYFDQGTALDQEDILDDIGSVQRFEEIAALKVTASKGKKEASFLINALPADTTLIKVFDRGYREISVPEEGLILEETAAEKLDAKIGDFLIIDGDKVKVAAISRENMDYISYCSMAQAEKIKADQVRTGFVCSLSKDYDRAALEDILADADGFKQITYSATRRSDADKAFDMLQTAVSLLSVFAFLIGLMAVYSLTRINYLERVHKYAMLKILGKSTFWISNHAFLEVCLQFIIGALLGGFVGRILSPIALKGLATAYISYPSIEAISGYLISALVVFSALAMGHYWVMLRLKRLSLSEEIKKENR